ncbi:MAG: hypothetical protein RIA65_12245 [Woeseia sp.]
MDYLGPQHADYTNVRALNRAFLDLLADLLRAQGLCHGLAPGLFERLQAQRSLQRERLASAPFLLFSLREADGEFWDGLFVSCRERDLFASAPSDQAVNRLVTASVAYLWQLARQNAYAARVICGASLHWCEQIAEQSLMDIVQAAACADVLRLRSPADSALWHKLLDDATSGERAVRDAARITALQRVLTDGAGQRTQRPALAARSFQPQAFRVADNSER